MDQTFDEMGGSGFHSARYGDRCRERHFDLVEDRGGEVRGALPQDTEAMRGVLERGNDLAQ